MASRSFGRVRYLGVSFWSWYPCLVALSETKRNTVAPFLGIRILKQLEGTPSLVEKPTGKTHSPIFWGSKSKKQVCRFKETAGKPILEGPNPSKNGHPSCVPWAPSPTSQEGLLQLVRPLGRRQGAENFFFSGAASFEGKPWLEPLASVGLLAPCT